MQQRLIAWCHSFAVLTRLMPAPHPPQVLQSMLPNSLYQFHQRRLLHHFWNYTATGLLIGALAALALAAFSTAAGWLISPLWPITLSAAAALIAATTAVVKRPTLSQTAAWLDSAASLNDAVATALEFSRLATLSPIQSLQLQLASLRLECLNPQHLVPLRTPLRWKQALIAAAAALLLVLVGPQFTRSASTAAPQISAAQTAPRTQAIKEQIRELQQQAQQDQSLTEALESMNQTLSELADNPGTPREAFAKLSNLENSLQQLQQQLQNPANSKALAEIGEALQLSEDTQPAGKALAEGDFQKAESELQKLNLPEADRQTRRAVAEQLRRIQQQSQQSSQTAQTGDAAEKMAEGLEKNNQQSFQDGAQQLAAQARQQASRKKMAEMLEQQSESLAAMRADFESQAGNVAQGQGKGGRKAGKGSAADPRGKASSQSPATAAKELRLKGENSGEGESQTETLPGEREEQTAEREYQQNLERYQSLQESSLDSEAIPPGQKQTIRRYFQLIRPKQN